jgi:hypothetical protein
VRHRGGRLDFRSQVDASVRLGHHPAHDDDRSLFAPSEMLQVASFRPIRELGVYPGTEHSLWLDVLLGSRESRTPRFEGSSYAVVIEK